MIYKFAGRVIGKTFRNFSAHIVEIVSSAEKTCPVCNGDIQNVRRAGINHCAGIYKNFHIFRAGNIPGIIEVGVKIQSGYKVGDIIRVNIFRIVVSDFERLNIAGLFFFGFVAVVIFGL